MYVNITTINEKRGKVLKREQECTYGRVWRQKREERYDVTL